VLGKYNIKKALGTSRRAESEEERRVTSHWQGKYAYLQSKQITRVPHSAEDRPVERCVEGEDGQFKGVV
jgi:hypothetical protein